MTTELALAEDAPDRLDVRLVANAVREHDHARPLGGDLRRPPGDVDRLRARLSEDEDDVGLPWSEPEERPEPRLHVEDDDPPVSF